MAEFFSDQSECLQNLQPTHLFILCHPDCEILGRTHKLGRVVIEVSDTHLQSRMFQDYNDCKFDENIAKDVRCDKEG